MLYQSEDQLSRVFGSFSLVSILIACLGLFGLAAYTSERKSKEISIRKVLGASIPGILVLLSREFAKLVLLAFLIACPVTYFLMTNWLREFAYQVEISAWLLGSAGLLVLGIALLTVGYQALRAASINPVEALRRG